jgi:hypothetical protein
MGEYRRLTEGEVKALRGRGCEAADWGRVQVSDGFRPEALRNARFSGDARLGRFEKTVLLPGGLELPSGITGAHLHDCSVGDDALIRNVSRHLARLDIEAGAVLDGVGLAATEGESSFGNGVKAETVNEAGGREVPLFDGLSAQMAYLVAFCRHRPKLVSRLEEMIAGYAASVTGSRGRIGAGARVLHAGTLINVRLGPAAVVEGAARLENVSVNSSARDPARVGDAVHAQDCIFCEGSHVTGGALLSKSFVGQGARVGRGFAAENSLLFANCEAFLGEACAAFLGPYSVTHHKSTLLIAGLYSFYNAGSGTNFSNHMYKLGPVHQGILERGCRTGSASYLTWPARLGAFSTLIGKHIAHMDTSDLPFSLLIEDRGLSVLVPAANLFTAGVRRDGLKWPARDRRRAADLLDLIHFPVLSPYTAGKLLAGRNLLARLETEGDRAQPYVAHGGVHIPRAQLAKGRQAYELALRLYLAGGIIARAEAAAGQGAEALDRALRAAREGAGGWMDLCGLLAPRSAVEAMLDGVENGALATLEQLQGALRELHARFADFEWAWILNAYLRESGRAAAGLDAAHLKELAARWAADTAEWGRRILADAGKEFAPQARLGYGLAAEGADRDRDFQAVRGALEGNSFVRGVTEEVSKVRERAEKLCAALGEA